MKWPRGKFNGQRIVGISFKFEINVREWLWCPVAGTCWKYSGGLHWLCFRTWTNWNFE